MLTRADTVQSSIKVSFVGDTGAGKSLIITQLLSFDDRIRFAKYILSFSLYHSHYLSLSLSGFRI
jgi:ABC-type multidrug transport system fused ATPase/permease subunit